MSAINAKTAKIDPTSYVVAEAINLLHDFGVYEGITFYPEFPVSELLPEHIKQIRKDVIVPTHAADMLAAMTANPDNEWPAILVWRDGNKHAIINGRHRHHVCVQTCRETFPVVVFDLTGHANPAALATEIAIKANLSNGLPTSTEERLLNALHLIMSHGKSAREAAEKTGLTHATLTRFKNEHVAKAALGSLGVRENLWGHLPQPALIALSKIKNKSATIGAAQFVQQAQITLSEDQTEFFNAVAALGDQDRQNEYIEQMSTKRSAAIAATMHGKTLPTPKIHPTSKALRNLAKVLDPATITGAYTTVAEIDQALTDLTAARDVTAKSIKALQRSRKNLVTAS